MSLILELNPACSIKLSLILKNESIKKLKHYSYINDFHVLPLKCLHLGSKFLLAGNKKTPPRDGLITCQDIFRFKCLTLIFLEVFVLLIDCSV